jgi:hypothetical protein
MTAEPRRSSWAVWIAGAVLVLYVLSYGPAYRLIGVLWQQNWKLTSAVLLVFYWPMGWLMHHGPEPISVMLDWYVRFWEP